VPVQNSIIDKINKSQEKVRPNFQVGDKVSVSVRLKEGDKERIQIFKGVVILKQPKSGKGPGSTFTVRKISAGVGVERIFPIHSPFIEKIDVESSSDVRRSRLYFLRELTGKKARLKESESFADAIAPEKAPLAASDQAAGETTETAAPVEKKSKEKSKK
jgi:large subunit ribosomal protein L19